MQRWFSGWRLWLAASMFFWACSPSLQLPEGAQISCSGDGLCPEGYVCRAAVGRCVPADSNTVAPRVTAQLVTPAVGKAGTGFTVVFDVTDVPTRLLQPVVKAEMPGRIELLTFDETASGGLHFVYRYLAKGDEPEGVVRVSAELTDTEFNATIAALGTFILDFKSPGLAGVAVAYTPDFVNPLRTVTAAKAGTIITVTAVANEALSTAPPTLTAINGSGPPLIFCVVGLTCPNDSRPSSFTSIGATFEATVPPGAADGVYAPTLVWTDVAGNQATALGFATPPIVVKTSPPSLVVDQSQVVYVRSPWGNSALETRPGGFVIPAGPFSELGPADPLSGAPSLPPSTFAISGDSIAQVRVWADADAGVLIGQGGRVDGGWPRFRLTALDAPQVFVTGLDPAGNESPTVKVTNAEWVATPNPPAFGQPPHRLDRTGFADSILTANPGTSFPAALGAEGSDAAAVVAVAERQWRLREVSAANPTTRSDIAMAYDSARGRVVLFGGFEAGTWKGDVWEWDGTSWVDKTPSGAVSPSARDTHSMVYDSGRGRIVLFGGRGAAGYKNDLWEWDGTSWVDKTPAGTKPFPRVTHALAYDSARGRVVLFGGWDGAARSRDLWEWDGTKWEDKTPAGTKPSARQYHAMAYDSARGRVVLFGGADGGILQDLWEWDGTSWIDKTPAGTRPPARYAHTVAYDSARNRIVVFGGANLSARMFDVWEWDGTAWLDKTPVGPRPSARSTHAMAYDSARGRVVVFGGWDGTTGSQDVWEWDGTTWVDKTPGGLRPSLRSYQAMAYDSLRSRVVLFGGTDAPGSKQDTWEWDGTNWVDKTTSGAKPSARNTHAMAYDSARGRVVLFGGLDGTTLKGDIWEWDGTTWVDKTPASGARPSARSHPAMAYDSVRGRVVLFGGKDATGEKQDVWDWDGTSWVDKTPSGTKPAARYVHALAYDAARARVVLFGGVGGITIMQDLWEWDGTTWVDKTPSGTKPLPRLGHGLAFDTVRSRLVLFGGVDLTSQKQDVWEWDGSGWVDRTPLGTKPSVRSRHSMAYDAASGRVVVFGGWDAVAHKQDLWEWDGTSWNEKASGGARPSARNKHLMTQSTTPGRLAVFGGYNGASYRQDLWEWDGTRWFDKTPSGTKPPERSNHAMAYDSTRGRLVVFGGWYSGVRKQDIWEWDGTGWVDKTPAGLKPSARDSSAMAFDSARGRIVLFGGTDGTGLKQDVWEWDGTSWADKTPAGAKPTARTFHAMAYDAARGRVVLFGGSDAPASVRQDVWEWDGTSWADKTPAATKPAARHSHTMAYDSARARIVLFAGYDGEYKNDLWEWDGTRWVDKTPTGTRPSVRYNHAMAYDTARGRVVVFGGEDATGSLQDVWELDADAKRHPAFQFTASARNAGIPASSLSGLRVRASCGGTFSPYGATDVGASLTGWATGTWTALGGNQIGVNASPPHLPAFPAAMIDWAAASPAQARSFFLERDAQLAFRCRPTGGSGLSANEASVALDYLEVRVRYQLP